MLIEENSSTLNLMSSVIADFLNFNITLPIGFCLIELISWYHFMQLQTQFSNSNSQGIY